MEVFTINGNSFVHKINRENLILQSHLHAFSLHYPEQAKFVVIDNGGFHSTKNITILDNQVLLK